MKKRFPNTRLRRLRSTKSLRNLIRENTLSPHDLIQPIFLIEGKNKIEKVKAMPDIFRYTIDKAIVEIRKLKKLGIEAIALFPCINKKHKDLIGSESYNANGLIQKAISEIKLKINDITIITDVALDPYTSHGQDGILSKKGTILNDETIEVLIKQSLSHAQCGADIIAPSDMMDGRIKKIREALEKNSYHNTILLSYAAKYSSNFYGPFRDAVGSKKSLKGDKKTYQMDIRNSDEAMREVAMDIKEGADMVIVKPGLPYLDIINNVKKNFKIPVLAYQVSGEYSLIINSIQKNIVDDKIIYETLMSFKRAGANAIITYFAEKIAKSL
mgnify:CR=1 FL=1